MNCDICNKEFVRNSNRQIYCKMCLVEWKKEYNKSWRDKNIEHSRLYGEKWRIDNREHYLKYMREYFTKYRNLENCKEIQRHGQKRYNKRYPEKIKAQNMASSIKIPKGELCNVCYENIAIEKHHPDYSKPLEVIFICVKCHNKIHRRD